MHKQRMESLAVSMREGGSTQSPALAAGEPPGPGQPGPLRLRVAQQPTSALSAGGEAGCPGRQSHFASQQLQINWGKSFNCSLPPSPPRSDGKMVAPCPVGLP